MQFYDFSVTRFAAQTEIISSLATTNHSIMNYVKLCYSSYILPDLCLQKLGGSNRKINLQTFFATQRF